MGSQTSILICGLMTSDTRQKAGKLFRGAPPGPGGVNVPTATGCAVIELTSLSLMAPSCSHVIAGLRPFPCANAVWQNPIKLTMKTATGMSDAGNLLI